MPTSTTETLLSQLRSNLGKDLRLVAKYDPASLEPLYVRDDVKSSRSQEDYELLHSTVLEDHQKRTELEESLGGGPLHASLLAFEDVLGANFLGGNTTRTCYYSGG